MEDTIFGKITRGEIPTDFLYQDEQCVVIKDIYPQAPTHVLIIPRKPIPMLSMADEEDQVLLGEVPYEYPPFLEEVQHFLPERRLPFVPICVTLV